MKFKNVKLARVVVTLQSLSLERSYRYHWKMAKFLLTSYVNCKNCVDNIVMQWSFLGFLFFFFFFFQIWKFLFFHSLQIAHHACTNTQAKNMFTEYIVIQKMGGSGLHTCWRTGLKQFQFFAVFQHFFEFYISSVVFFYSRICLSTRFLFLINTIVQHLTFVCFCFAWRPDPPKSYISIPINISYVILHK